MSVRRNLLQSASLAILMAAAFVGSASAQQASKSTFAGTSRSRDADATVAELIVTAEKREQNIHEVPVAISAFSDKQRDLTGIESVQDISNFTPGMTYDEKSDRITMRGIGKLSPLRTSDNSVAVYLDGFYSPSSAPLGADTLFSDRVEILRGPQGTLYGRNSIGGAVNVISKRPTKTWSGEARIEEGNYGYGNYEAAVSGPLTDHLRIRLAGSYTDQSQGYFKNLYPGAPSEGGVVHNYFVEGQVEAELNDRVDLWVKLSSLGGRDNRGGPGSLQNTPNTNPYDTDIGVGGVTFNSGFAYSPLVGQVTTAGVPLGPVAGSVQGGCGVTQNPATKDIRTFCHNTPYRSDLNDQYSVVGTLTFHADAFDVKYTGGYTQSHSVITADQDTLGVDSYQIPLLPGSPCATTPGCTALTVYPSQTLIANSQTSSYSHELTLSSTKTDSPLQWIAGLYYFSNSYNNPLEINTDRRQVQFLGQLGGFKYIFGTPAPADTDFTVYKASVDMRDTSAAAYGQVDWNLTPTVKLTGGLRYTSDHRQGVETFRLALFSGVVFNPTIYGTIAPAYDLTPLAASTAPATGVAGPTTALPNGDYTRALSHTSTAYTGTAGVEWTPTDETLAYLRYSRGYKAFAFNAGTVSSSVFAEPELANAYEVGFKRTWGRTLSLDSAIYYTDYREIQIPIGVNTNGIIVQQFYNIPRARSDGFEALLNWSPFSHFNVNLTYSFNDSKLLSGCEYSAAANTFSGTCIVDTADPKALLAGAKPVGPLASNGQQAQSVSGSYLPQAPRNKLALNANYTFVFDPGRLTLSASYIWRDQQYSSVFKDSFEAAPSWDQVDLRATWADQNDRYEVTAYVRNLFDTLGYESAGGAVPQSYGTSRFYDLTPPRTYGVKLRYKFF